MMTDPNDLTNLPGLADEPDTDLDESETEAAIDPRHLKRIKVMQALFAESFNADQLDEELPSITSAKKILAEAAEIDQLLQEAAPERPIADINKVDLAILRLIVFESRHKKTPKKVLLNEAIELAKEYGTESSPAFVNAVLGHILLPDAA